MSSGDGPDDEAVILSPYGDDVEPTESSACPLHESGADPRYLTGQRIERVLASWHIHDAEEPSGPLDIWLVDSTGTYIHVTTGSDWCLIVETAAPFPDYDMAEWGRVVVAPITGETPFANHVGKIVRSVREERELNTGRIALEVMFESGGVRCESWSGELRLASIPHRC